MSNRKTFIQTRQVVRVVSTRSDSLTLEARTKPWAEVISAIKNSPYGHQFQSVWGHKSTLWLLWTSGLPSRADHVRAIRIAQQENTVLEQFQDIERKIKTLFWACLRRKKRLQSLFYYDFQSKGTSDNYLGALVLFLIWSNRLTFSVFSDRI